jgi:hypothetical protein
VAVLLGPEKAVRDESKAFKKSPGGDIGFIDARVDPGATAPGEEPVDQGGGGFAAVSHPVVIRVEQVADAGMVRGNAPWQWRLWRIPRPGVTDYSAR